MSYCWLEDWASHRLSATEFEWTEEQVKRMRLTMHSRTSTFVRYLYSAYTFGDFSSVDSVPARVLPDMVPGTFPWQL